MQQILTFVVLITAANPPEAHVTLRDGTESRGIVSSITDEAIVLQQADAATTLDRNKILQIEFGEQEELLSQSATTIVMNDGSRLASDRFEVDKDVATMSLENKIELRVPTASLHYVRFGKSNAKLDEQWDEILTTKIEADAIVIRRPDSVVNFLEGVLSDISDAQVRFQYDDEWNDVKREKVDGVVYFALNRPVFPAATSVASTRNGTTIQVETMSLDGETLKIVSTNKTKFSLPINSVRQLEFIQTNTDFLSDLEMDYTWEPDLPLPLVAKELEELNRPSMDKSLLGKRLAIAMKANGRDIREFEKGVAFHSKTEASYRLAGEYRRFQSLAGIDEQIVPHGNLKLVVMGDDRVLFEKMITGTDAAVELDIDVAGVRRMKIVVDFGDKSGLGDHLNLCEARLTK